MDHLSVGSSHRLQGIMAGYTESTAQGRGGGTPRLVCDGSRLVRAQRRPSEEIRPPGGESLVKLPVGVIHPCENEEGEVDVWVKRSCDGKGDGGDYGECRKEG